MEKYENADLRKAATRTIAIFAFIFVIVLGIFGSLALAKAVPGLFSGMAAAVTSVFSNSPSDTENAPETTTPQNIAVSLPTNTVAHNQTFTLSWGHTGKTTDGTYSFRYDCVNGVSFTSPATSGAATDIVCGTSFNLKNTIGSIALTAHSSATANADVGLHIDYIPNGASQAVASGSAVLTVEKPVVKTTPTTNTGGTTTTVTYPTTAVSDPNGFVDLSVRIVGVGVVNRNTGTFYSITYPSRSSQVDRIALRFEVKNQGTKTSPQWFFRADLPTAQSYTFNSQAQTALRPGESIIFTLAFDGFTNSNTGNANITVDPSNYVVESNEGNNYVTQVITTVP